MAVVVNVYGKADLRAIDKAQQSLDKLRREAGKSSGGISGAFKKMGSVANSAFGRISSAVAGLGIGTWLKGSIDVAVQAEASWAKLGKAVGNAGGDFAKLRPQIEKVIASQSALTGNSKGELRNALTQLVSTTGSYGKSMKLLGLTQDLARTKGLSLEKAGMLVGKVAMGNTSALTRYGIVLKKGASSQAALAALQKRFGGQAKAYGDTAAGAQDKFNNSLKGLQSTVGTALLPAVSKMMDGGSKLIGMFDKLPASTKGVVVGIGAVAAAALLANSAFGPVGAVVAAVAAAGFLLYTNWDKVKGSLGPIPAIIDGIMGAFGKGDPKKMAGPYAQFGITLKNAFNGAKQVVVTVASAIGGAFTRITGAMKAGGDGGILKSLSGLGKTLMTTLGPAWSAVKQFGASLMSTFKLVVNWVVANMPLIKKTIATVIGAVTATWKKLSPIIVPIIKATFGVASKVVSTVVKTVLGVVKAAMQLLTGDWRGAWKTIVSTFKTLFGGIVDIGKQIIDGLVKGLKAAWKAVTSTLGDLFSGAVKFVKNLLGIKSPSRVFTSIGEQIVNGLTLGIKKKKTDVTSAAASIAKALYSSFAKQRERAGALANTWGIFDAPDVQMTSGASLIANMRAQVDTLSKWRTNIASLSKRGISKSLLQQLRDEGPAAAGQIAALAGMSSADLKVYNSLYGQRSSVATGAARDEYGNGKSTVTIASGAVKLNININGNASEKQIETVVNKALKKLAAEISRGKKH